MNRNESTNDEDFKLQPSQGREAVSPNAQAAWRAADQISANERLTVDSSSIPLDEEDNDGKEAKQQAASKPSAISLAAGLASESRDISTVALLSRFVTVTIY
ncbi:hypothetical protein MMC29_007424 [Sticta canariensis]|nr:hypothetical protein [Sticta canariensis]